MTYKHNQAWILLAVSALASCPCTDVNASLNDDTYTNLSSTPRIIQ